MLLESVVGPILFVFLFLGVVAAYLGQTYAPVYENKYHLTTCADICSGAATLWIFYPIILPVVLSGGMLIFTLVVGLIFALITVYFYIGASKLKETL